jgi:REP element-mobilizing transposase RayT
LGRSRLTSVRDVPFAQQPARESHSAPLKLTSGKAFVDMDRILDHGRTGPRYLQNLECAEVVMKALRDGEQRFNRYQLHSWVVMPNHVHILVTPHVVAPRWLAPLKGFTAYRVNRLLKRKGTFWQDESYDHFVRSDEEFSRIQKYIENNPVSAGLAPSLRSTGGRAARPAKPAGPAG